MFPEITSHAGLVITLLAVGATGGLLSGMLGVGGGVVFVPALYFTLSAFAPGSEDVMQVAIGTSLALVMVTGASSAFWHNKKALSTSASSGTGRLRLLPVWRWGPISLHPSTACT